MTDIINITTILSNLATVIAILLALWVGKKQLDDMRASRHADMIKTVFETWNTQEMYEAYNYTQQLEFKDWNDFKEKNPQGSKGWQQWSKTLNFFNTIGILVKTQALDAEVAHMMLKALPMLWEKVMPLVTGYRVDLKSPNAGKEFEWLYYDMKKRNSTS